MSPDASLRFRQLVDNALTHLTWHAEVVRELGVEGISQVWDENPAWYLWLGGRAYLLRYPGLEEYGNELTAVLHAFPTAEELDDSSYSATELRLLEPEHFDHATMTPRFESFERFAEAFIIGELTVVPGPLGVASLTASSYRHKWDLTWRFTDVFVALLSFYRRSAPVKAPLGFSPQQGVSSVFIPFEEKSAGGFVPPAGSGPTRSLPYPAHWRQLAQGKARCSATGTCSCSH